MGNTPSILDVAAILITLAAALSWLNHKLFKLRSTVGLALMGAEPPPRCGPSHAGSRHAVG